MAANWLGCNVARLLEIGMLRFACLLGIAVLAVTAVSLASSQKSNEENPPEPDQRPNCSEIPLARTRNLFLVYPMQFSLN